MQIHRWWESRDKLSNFKASLFIVSVRVKSGNCAYKKTINSVLIILCDAARSWILTIMRHLKFAVRLFGVLCLATKGRPTDSSASHVLEGQSTAAHHRQLRENSVQRTRQT